MDLKVNLVKVLEEFLRLKTDLANLVHSAEKIAHIHLVAVVFGTEPVGLLSCLLLHFEIFYVVLNGPILVFDGAFVRDLEASVYLVVQRCL